MVKSHKHGAAVYYKHWSEDPSKGRDSIVKVKNVGNNEYLSIPVDKIGLKKDYFVESLEEFFSKAFESQHDKYMGIIEKIAQNPINSTELKNINPLIFNLIFRSPDILERINDFYAGSIKNLNQQFPKIEENEEKRNYIKYRGFQIDDDEPNIRHSQLFAWFHEQFANSRQFPISIREVKDTSLITCDNPVLHTRTNVGTIYTMTLNPEFYMCLGYIVHESYFDKIISTLNGYYPSAIEINRALEKQAQTFIIL